MFEPFTVDTKTSIRYPVGKLTFCKVASLRGRCACGCFGPVIETFCIDPENNFWSEEVIRTCPEHTPTSRKCMGCMDVKHESIPLCRPCIDLMISNEIELQRVCQFHLNDGTFVCSCRFCAIRKL